MRALAKLRAVAPYALMELILPGGSVMALLLWLYRRQRRADNPLAVGGPFYSSDIDTMHPQERLRATAQQSFDAAMD